MPGEAAKAGQGAAAADSSPSAPPTSSSALEAQGPASRPAMPAAAGLSADQQRRQAQWSAAWLRQRHAQVADSIAALSAPEQAGLCDALADDMAARQVHPSIRKRLQGSGWQHPMVLHEMLRFYARGAIGEHWDQPTPAQLLAVAAALGDKAGDAEGTAGSRFG